MLVEKDLVGRLHFASDVFLSRSMICLQLMKGRHTSGNRCTRTTVPLSEAVASRDPSWFQAMAACQHMSLSVPQHRLGPERTAQTSCLAGVRYTSCPGFFTGKGGFGQAVPPHQPGHPAFIIPLLAATRQQRVWRARHDTLWASAHIIPSSFSCLSQRPWQKGHNTNNNGVQWAIICCSKVAPTYPRKSMP